MKNQLLLTARLSVWLVTRAGNMAGNIRTLGVARAHNPWARGKARSPVSIQK
jgi:hypothetical protein